MERLNFRPFLIMFLLVFFILACHRAAVQPKKETTEPLSIPDCKKNYTREGSLLLGPVYKTWVRYNNLDFKSAFDAAVMSVQAGGNRLIFTDPQSGAISAEMVFETRVSPYPINIKITKENSFLIIYLSVKATGGATGPMNLCSFYEEFDRLVERTPEAPKPKQVPETPKKPSEDRKPLGQPPPVAAPEPSPRTTQVTVPSENLRDKPQGKIIGKVNKGTSLAILEEKEKWLRVRLEDGTEAWIWRASTSEAAKSSPSASQPPPPKSPM